MRPEAKASGYLIVPLSKAEARSRLGTATAGSSLRSE
jgi:hypothetical protein